MIRIMYFAFTVLHFDILGTGIYLFSPSVPALNTLLTFYSLSGKDETSLKRKRLIMGLTIRFSGFIFWIFSPSKITQMTIGL